MVRIKCTAAYDGTNFSGYQVQPEMRTVQGEIEASLSRIHKGQPIKITSSGRTDAGVHARAQVFHFDTPLSIPDPNWPRALNAQLPDDIFIHQAETVPSDFHARFDVKVKEYRYRLLISEEPDMFRRLYTYHMPKKLDLNKMNEACQYFIGTHDFTSFCAANTSVTDKVRTIYSMDVSLQGDEAVIAVKGQGFLYQMVRIMTGALIEAGLNRMPPYEIKDILLKKDRRAAPKTAPAHGLTMWKVTY
ncbi:tRNA pseudouridine38-40 synthase [Scopulibacillus daqui]|uniref:tRNA pseudouridine synthase A n=1 Tax=Scopulibacillus daqui TaxID=1469162 RepID=A0ABS2Q3L5_9BACL|nr:tRNA pseudouridine(38-40) synthase TruA [Scopulibacillus daqui]MBM7646892.1 tRNA pseudouridine38-40 synthase [Scopulibacillus daqui]